MYRYPSANPVTPPRPKTRRKTKVPRTHDAPRTSGPTPDASEEAPNISDADLLAEFHVPGAAPEELLGYDDDDDEDEEEDLADDGSIIHLIASQDH